MVAKAKEYVCINENKFQDHETKISQLEARADFKDKRIDQIISDNKMMVQKLDKINESIHQLQLKSAKDDFNIDNRVTSLENTVNVLKWITTLLFGSGILWLLLAYLH